MSFPKLDTSKGEKLLALALDKSTTEEERRTAAVALCRWMQDELVLTRYTLIEAGFLKFVDWVRANRGWFIRHGVRVPNDL